MLMYQVVEKVSSNGSQQVPLISVNKAKFCYILTQISS